MSQKYFRFELLQKEFVFLQEFVQAEIEDSGGFTAAQVINSITIKVADDTLLSSKATEDLYSWSGGPGHHHYCRIAVVWLDGDWFDFGYLAAEVNDAAANGNWSREEALTIGEQMAEQSLRKPDFIVVREKQDHDDWGRGQVTRNIVIFKMAKFDLEGYYARKIDEAAAELKAELARLSS